MANEKIKVDATEMIIIEDDMAEDELRELSREELLHRLNFDETNPETIKLIKKILKEKK